MLPISPQKSKLAEDEEYSMLSRMPSGFSYEDPKTISVFSERLRSLRTAQADEKAEACTSDTRKRAKLKKLATQDQLALELGVSSMTVSKYERGKIKRVPVKHLRRICAYYSVTPHYLLGLVDGKNSTLDIDSSGEILCNEDGTPKILIQPMMFLPATVQKAIEDYRTLNDTDPKAFWLLNKLVVAQGEVKERSLQILRILLNDS